MGSNLYECLCHYTHPPHQLASHGYPRPVLGSPGTVTIVVPRTFEDCLSSIPLQRICCKCKQQFYVTPDGNYATAEQCVHHTGRSKGRRGSGSSKFYTCCGRSEGSRGCHTSKSHVHLQNQYTDLTGYVQTRAGARPPDGNYGIYAVDSEMIHTTAGLELASVTVVDHELKTVYEQLVKPANPVIDYNTRFSGLTESALKDVTISLKDVQDHLLGLFSEGTILVGHSLEHDMIALKMMHSKVVDTSLLFPHHLGPPYKLGLQRLCSEKLGKTIQGDGGHSSREDAVAAMELVLYKMRQDPKWRR